MCYSRNKGKHITLQDRNDILSCLQRNLKLIEIVHYVHCDPRTISKEIRKNRILKKSSNSNQCIHRFSCHIIGLCGFCLNKECRSCKLNNCNQLCKRFDSNSPRSRLQKFPFTCNGCVRRMRKAGEKPQKTEKFICKFGRFYEEFLDCITLYPKLDIWEMDTVEGKKGGKALMTLLHRKSNANISNSFYL